MTLGKHQSTRKFEVISTGAISLDLALGIGGVAPEDVLLKFMALNLLGNQH